MDKGTHFIIVSNRLPAVIERTGGEWCVRGGSGGLVTAMAPVLRNRGGIWIGWPGIVTEDNVDPEQLLAENGKKTGYTLKPVLLTREEKENFYHGFANEIIWPLFHSFGERCNFNPTYWRTYETVNAKYANTVLDCFNGNKNYIWVHDYHLMLVAAELRRMGVRSPIGFFLHIPFPPLDIFLKLPWRFQILRALLAYDMIGFQTVRDRRNFVQCIRTLLKKVIIRGRGRIQTITVPGQPEVSIGSFPISIDFDEFSRGAATPEVTAQVEQLKRDYLGRKVILGLDRLDYTKGIRSRLRAFGEALEHYPELHHRVTMVQVVVPSRESVRAYQQLKEEIDEIVGTINGQHTQAGWVPIHYLFRSLSRVELLAYYRLADVGLITPLNDGMNLVAKEYCACNLDEKGVLVLSEFAGAAAELQQDALLVNPYDIEGTAQAIRDAVIMEESERHSRMKRLRRLIRRKDISWWLNCSLQASFSRRLDDLAPEELFVPEEDPANGVNSILSEKSKYMPMRHPPSPTQPLIVPIRKVTVGRNH